MNGCDADYNTNEMNADGNDVVQMMQIEERNEEKKR